MSSTQRRRAVYILDNHYAPDVRVEMEIRLIRSWGWEADVICWDRRPTGRAGEVATAVGANGERIFRLSYPAPPGGGAASVRALCSFGRHVWTRLRNQIRGADILVACDIYILPIGRALSAALKTPFIYDAHEEYSAMEGDRYPRWALNAIEWCESLLAAKALGVVVPGTSRAPRWSASKIRPVVLPNLGRWDKDRNIHSETRWDVVYCGTVSPARRTDLLIELARRRPDLQIGVAGLGRAAADVDAAAAQIPNLTYFAWRADPDEFLASSKIVYYGLDRAHPYSAKACPNTLYQAIRVRRPLLYLCGGEPEETSKRFRIGTKADATVCALSEAVDSMLAGGTEWEFDAAWSSMLQAHADGVENYRRLFELRGRPMRVTKSASR